VDLGHSSIPGHIKGDGNDSIRFHSDIACQLLAREEFGVLGSVAHKRLWLSRRSMEYRAGATLCVGPEGGFLASSREHLLSAYMHADLGQVTIDEVSDAVMGNAA